MRKVQTSIFFKDKVEKKQIEYLKMKPLNLKIF